MVYDDYEEEEYQGIYICVSVSRPISEDSVFPELNNPEDCAADFFRQTARERQIVIIVFLLEWQSAVAVYI